MKRGEQNIHGLGKFQKAEHVHNCNIRRIKKEQSRSMF